MRNKRYTVRISFTVPKDTKSELKERAKARGISMGELMRRITRGLGESAAQ